MKTTKTIKERLIKISRNEKIGFTITIIPWIMLFIWGLIAAQIPMILPLRVLLCILLFSIPMSFNTSIKLIRKKDEKIIRQNKLINVLLSDRLTVSSYFVNILFNPLLAGMIIINDNIPVWLILLIVIVVSFCSFKLGQIISKHFEQKLSK